MTERYKRPRQYLILDSYVKQGLLDDRREYTVDDFKSAHGLTQNEAESLKYLVDLEIRQPTPRTDDELETAYSGLKDEDIGQALKEYLEGSNEQCWEGFTSRDKTGAKRLLSDLYIYIMNRDSGREGSTKKIK